MNPPLRWMSRCKKQILRLIAGMQARHGTAILFVTHDLGVVSKVCQKLSVLLRRTGR